MIAKTIIVTGANGLLGQKLIIKLSRREAVQLIATGTGPNRNPLDEGYEYLEMDVTSAASMRRPRLTALLKGALLERDSMSFASSW